MSTSRVLAAIMFTDIEGYTSLMQESEKTANEIRERHHSIITATVGKKNGKILKYYGDGTLIMFTSAIDAVNCALEMQLSFNEPPDVPVRIGIHLGDVMIKGNDIFGDAVNTASRIESLGTSGSILISAKVQQEIKNHKELKVISVGHFTFKNIAEPLEVFALSNEGLKIPGSEEMVGKGKIIRKEIPNNLPNPATRFFGRINEVAEIRQLLSDHRLVTLLGPGGCGKTRLAMEVAKQSITEFVDGVYFIGLAYVSNPDLVAETFAEILMIKPEKDKPIEITIAARIREKNLLLIIDNCEHVINECARILELLINNTRNPKFLTTSREVLHIPGESGYRIPSLSFPERTVSFQEITGYESIQLFVDRVLLNKTDFALTESNCKSISSICQKLDGIPLAIEMAASRVKMMEPAKILERIDSHFNLLISDVRSAPARHQTLQATINWSMELLTSEERTLIYRLSVFSGDFDLEDAEEVCAYDPIDKHQVLDLLTSLADKSLITLVERNSTNRFSLLEIIKQYGKERLSKNNELEVLESAYCEFYLEKTGTAYLQRITEAFKWLTWFDLEFNNIQGALTLLKEKPLKFLELASHMSDFLYEHAYINYAREILGEALEVCKDRNVHRCRVLCVLGFLEHFFLNNEEGYKKTCEGAELAIELKDEQCILDTTPFYIHEKALMGEITQSNEISARALEIARRRNDPIELRIRLFSVWNYVSQMNVEPIKHEIDSLMQEALASQNPFDITLGAHIYGDVPLIEGDYKVAESRYIEATKRAAAWGNILQVDIELQGIAMSIAGQGRYEKALKLFGAAIAKFEEFGVQMITVNFWIQLIQNNIGKAIEAVGPEKAQALDQAGRQMDFNEALEYAYAIEED